VIWLKLFGFCECVVQKEVSPFNNRHTTEYGPQEL